jgi:hypothetical protein
MMIIVAESSANEDDAFLPEGAGVGASGVGAGVGGLVGMGVVSAVGVGAGSRSKQFPPISAQNNNNPCRRLS